MTIYTKGVITQQEKARGREYTPKQANFLKMLIKNGFQDALQCAKDAGYKKNPWQLIYSLKEDIREISESLLIGSSPAAALTVTTIATSDKPMPNAATRLAAAKDVLDRSGVIKEEKHTIDHNVNGIFLLPMKTELPVEAEEDALEAEYVEEVDDECINSE